MAGARTDLDQYCSLGLSYTFVMDRDTKVETSATNPTTTDDNTSVFGDGLRDILMRAHIRHQDLVRELDRLGVQVDPMTGSVTFRQTE